MSPHELDEIPRPDQGLYLWCGSGIVVASLVAGLCVTMVRIHHL